MSDYAEYSTLLLIAGPQSPFLSLQEGFLDRLTQRRLIVTGQSQKALRRVFLKAEAQGGESHS